MSSVSYKAWYTFFLNHCALLIQYISKYISTFLKSNFLSLQMITMLSIAVILTTYLSLKLMPLQNSVSQAKLGLPYALTLSACQQQHSCSCNINQVKVLVWFPFYCCWATFQPVELPEQTDCEVAWHYTWCYYLCFYYSYHTHPVLHVSSFPMKQLSQHPESKCVLNTREASQVLFSLKFAVNLFYRNTTINILSFSA